MLLKPIDERVGSIGGLSSGDGVLCTSLGLGARCATTYIRQRSD